ncbi:MAG: S66 peptidase family protein [archaeon]
MIANKFKKGSTIRVCSPARNLSIITPESRKIANDAFERLGLNVTFSKNAEETGMFRTSSVKTRVTDLHDAFKDKSVDGILTTIGGFSSNNLLQYLDYKLIKKNPKILCGYSDITALTNAIYAKTGLVTYSGPHYATFAMKKGNEYSAEYFKKCLFDKKPFDLETSEYWSDDKWWIDQEKRDFIKNEGYKIIQEGNSKAKGAIIGGNLCTFILLHGTEYMPKLKNSILFLEDDEAFGNIFDVMFDRHLQSILQQKDANKIRAIVIGKPKKIIDFKEDKIRHIISTKKELEGIPVISNATFGHAYPICTFPIGGKASVSIEDGKAKIKILEH